MEVDGGGFAAGVGCQVGHPSGIFLGLCRAGGLGGISIRLRGWVTMGWSRDFSARGW